MMVLENVDKRLDRIEAKFRKEKGIKPIQKIKEKLFDESSLYVIAAGYVIVLIFYFNEIVNYLWSNKFIRTAFLLIACLAGSMLIIFHAFVKKTKSEKEKTWMVMSAIILTFLIGLIVGAEMLIASKSWWLILPAINILSSLYYYALFRSGKLGQHNMHDRDAGFIEIFILTMIVLGIAALCKYVLLYDWYITMSVMITISSIFGAIVKYRQ